MPHSHIAKLTMFGLTSLSLSAVPVAQMYKIKDSVNEEVSALLQIFKKSVSQCILSEEVAKTHLLETSNLEKHYRNFSYNFNSPWFFIASFSLSAIALALASTHLIQKERSPKAYNACKNVLCLHHHHPCNGLSFALLPIPFFFTALCVESSNNLANYGYELSEKTVEVIETFNHNNKNCKTAKEVLKYTARNVQKTLANYNSITGDIARITAYLFSACITIYGIYYFCTTAYQIREEKKICKNISKTTTPEEV